MKTVIVLAMHGAPPNDFPKRELGEFFGLHSRLEHAAGSDAAQIKPRHDELDAKIRAWARTAQNDPYWAGSREIANELAREMKCEVIIGFNEFCAPTLAAAFDQAAERAARVIVLTPMMTRGGEHSEKEIPHAIDAARQRHPAITFQYVWPLDTVAIAQFLANQITNYERFARITN
ncbi:MAG: CbiX/SirB N-terminal domain-containing protein [Chloroflexi bacterium]|nr:CbiX/SirB N-terminal domain-containing protein [Chloroflexota bacterium]